MENQTDKYIVSLKGSYSWNLLFDIDNRENAGVVKKLLETRSSIFCDYNGFNKAVQAEKISVTSLKETILEVTEVDYVGEIKHEVKVRYEYLFKKKTNFHLEKTGQVDTYEVGPNCQLKLYQLVFSGPGMHHVTETLSSKPYDMGDVTIRVTVKPLHFLGNIDVVYTKDAISRPDNVITPDNGTNPNINAGVDGSYVWLVPIWTTMIKEAVTDIQKAAQFAPTSEHSNLLPGRFGKGVYLKMIQDVNSKEVITKVGLFRRSSLTSTNNPLENGWQHKILIKRVFSGKHLYLCWNTTSI